MYYHICVSVTFLKSLFILNEDFFIVLKRQVRIESVRLYRLPVLLLSRFVVIIISYALDIVNLFLCFF